jgi:hypothetical protein
MTQGVNLEALEAALEEGKTLGEIDVAALAPPAPAEKPEAQPDSLDEALSEIPTELRGKAKEVIERFAEEQRQRWESGATQKFQQAAQYEALQRSLQKDPEGTIEFLRGRMGIAKTSKRDEPDPETAYVARVAELKAKATSPESTSDQQWEAVQEYTKLETQRAVQQVGRRVAPMEQAIAKAYEQDDVSRIQRDYPEVALQELLPHVEEVQGQVAKSPYLSKREAIFGLIGERLVKENRELKAQLTQRGGSADKARAVLPGGQTRAVRGSGVRDMDLSALENLVDQAFPGRD